MQARVRLSGSSQNARGYLSGSAKTVKRRPVVASTAFDAFVQMPSNVDFSAMR